MSLTWIAAISLLGIIFALLVAPALDVRLTRRVVNPMLVAAMLLAFALALSNSAAYADDPDAIQTLGVLSGILVAASLFLVAFAAARFALGDMAGPMTGTSPRNAEEARGNLV